MTGAIRAGHAIFVISPRNSPVAVAHLLNVTGCSVLYVSDDKSMQGLSAAAIAQAKKEHGWSVAVEVLPNYEDVYDDGKKNTEFEMLPNIEFSMNALALLAHSSGICLSFIYAYEFIYLHKIRLNCISKASLADSQNTRAVGTVSKCVCVYEIFAFLTASFSCDI